MKRLIFVLLMIATLMLVGCGATYENTAGVHFWKDAATGVYYVVHESNNGIGVCPRYNADGTLYTGGAE
jgi:outer membrane biogenesis lipoprotein LolB